MNTNPLIDFLASRIAEYENNNEKFAEFDKAVAAMPVGVALLRTLIDQHNLTYGWISRTKSALNFLPVRFCLDNDP